MFIELFRVLYLVKNQAFKVKLLGKEKIHNVFYVLSIEQDITRKKQVDKNVN